jgi:glycosyltransferase involved in cell wall biosynthesis
MRKFSLIIPVYKQQQTIKRDIEDVISVLATTKVDFEIIPVIDGLLDRSYEEARKIRDPRVRVVGYQTNHGKGYAVRYGFSHATGDVIGFKDCGGDLKSKALPLMLAQFEFQKADIIIGSKRHSASRVNYPLSRRLLSFGYQLIVRALFGLNIRDSQVGIKLYRRIVLEDVLPRLLVKEFAFDIEMLAVAYHLGYRRIYEAPVELDFPGFSSITSANFWRIILRTLWDTAAVFYRLRIRHYYDTTNKRAWRFDPELNFRVNTG